MHVVPKSRHDFSFLYLKYEHLKCCEFFYQVVQKYIINKLVKKRRNCKPSWSVYSMFICYFLKQPLHNYGVYKMAEKKERRRSLCCMTRNIRINYCTKHITWFLCQVTGESRPGLGMTGQHTLCNSQVQQNT